MTEDKIQDYTVMNGLSFPEIFSLFSAKSRIQKSDRKGSDILKAKSKNLRFSDVTFNVTRQHDCFLAS